MTSKGLFLCTHTCICIRVGRVYVWAAGRCVCVYKSAAYIIYARAMYAIHSVYTYVYVYVCNYTRARADAYNMLLNY